MQTVLTQWLCDVSGLKFLLSCCLGLAKLEADKDGESLRTEEFRSQALGCPWKFLAYTYPKEKSEVLGSRGRGR